MIKCSYRDLAGLRDQTITTQGANQITRPGPLTKLAQADDTRVPLLMDRIRIGRFVTKIIAAIKEMEADAMELLKKYGKQDEKNPAMFNIPPESRTQFNEENNKLNDTECEITLLPLPESVYGRLPFTAGDLMALMKFIELSPEMKAELAKMEEEEEAGDEEEDAPGESAVA
jgi:hypothetical protein